MAEQRKCENCGAPLGADAPAAQCSACLLAVGLGPHPERQSTIRPDGNRGELNLSNEVANSLAKYDILQQVGRGGMGVVYRARHKALEMDVAIKLLLGGRPGERFVREAKLLAKIQCPYVVRILDLDVLPDGTPMLVMEWVEGRDLQRTLKAEGGRLPESQAITWMRQVCEGMIAAGAEGIIHRDLKPSNVLIDKQERAKLADFGLARSGTVENSTITQDGAHILGTPYYMAPEQAEDPRSVDVRSDIYSFGAMFYHLLTGEPPFKGETHFAVLLKHKLEPLVSPKARCEGLSEATSQLIERCLAKSPQDRFQSFADVFQHLRQGSSELAWEGHEAEIPADCLARFQSRFGDYVRGAVAAGGETYEFAGGRLSIVCGDIAQQRVDAVVSSDDSDLSMSGGVSRAIRRAAGEFVWQEAQRYVPVRVGRAVVTSGGNLKSRFVFHGVTLGWSGWKENAGTVSNQVLFPSRDLIIEIMKSCLDHADTLNLYAIAFPLLGTGKGRFSREVCLDTMFRYLARTLQRGLTSVKVATLVLYRFP